MCVNLFCPFISTKSTNKESFVKSCPGVLCNDVLLCPAQSLTFPVGSKNYCVLYWLKYLQIASHPGLQKFQHSVWMFECLCWRISLSHPKEKSMTAFWSSWQSRMYHESLNRNYLLIFYLWLKCYGLSTIYYLAS